MKTKREILDYCLTYPSVYEDYPFDETTALVRHSTNKKMFALVDHLQGRLQISLKCEPLRADFLRNAFESVVPGYHLNKTHWNTVYIDGDVPEAELRDMIQHSYDLTKPKVKKKVKKS